MLTPDVKQQIADEVRDAPPTGAATFAMGQTIDQGRAAMDFPERLAELGYLLLQRYEDYLQ